MSYPLYDSELHVTLKGRLDAIESRLERIEKLLASSLLAPAPQGPHTKGKRTEVQSMGLFDGLTSEGAQHHSGGGRRTASAVAGIGEVCVGGAVAGALGHTERSAVGDGLLAPLGALPGQEGMEDHAQNALSREKCKSPLKKNADVKVTHPLKVLWNLCAPLELPRWLTTNPTRKRRADALIKEHGTDTLADAIRRIGQSDFLMGRGIGSRAANWKASPEWFLRPGNVTRILEGEFDSLNPGSQRSAVSGFGPSHPMHPDNIAKRRKS